MPIDENSKSLSGSVAEWSKALVLGTSLFGGVGSNPTAAKILFSCWKIPFLFSFVTNLNGRTLVVDRLGDQPLK